MKYLNRIIFINSADKSIKYAEINLDGNVHFIGTQGVGKSTLLRAILFFYNADKQKLGIPREKKTFDEYYFPYQNSYIVYEVQTENGLFCVLAFKSQGRVAFRFFDIAFNKTFFIDSEGRAYESWDKTREALGKNTYYTKIIHSYEEYRNIIYGNNKGLSNEFRKYALIESKQFQNIPRTIANVFLNTNLSAEFVKETIIKSLDEEEIKIDLTTYSQNHLKDFEANLNDIKKWTDRTRNGENQIEKQADNVATFYAALKYLEKKKEDLASQLAWALEYVKEQQPKVEKELEAEELKQTKIKTKLSELNSVFNDKKVKIERQIGECNGKLTDMKSAKTKYNSINIESILERVSNKISLELKHKSLISEKGILTSQFFEIEQRYEALLNQLKNQLKEFENSKQTEKNTATESLLHFKEELTKQYDLLYDEIRKQHKESLNVANELVKEKENGITENKIKRSEIKNKRFYEKEIEDAHSEIRNLEAAIVNAKNAILQASEKTKNIQNEWELAEISVKEDTKRKIEKQKDQQKQLNQAIFAIDTKIENSKDSLYGWLNEEVPDWDKTIGKVIDEENILFKSGLNPKKISTTTLSFYGISIDINEIDKTVKTVADLQNDKAEYENQIQAINREIANLGAQSYEEIEKLRKKFHPKIKEQKEIVQKSEYDRDQSQFKVEETNVKLASWKTKAKAEQNAGIDRIDAAIGQLTEESLKAEEQLQKIAESIDKLIETKKKEKEGKIKIAQQNLTDMINKIDLLIQNEQTTVSNQINTIKSNQSKELDTKGANTKRIDEIKTELASVESELAFIETHRDIVAEYNKDKRELFDKESEFKSKKVLLEKQLETEQEKNKQLQEKLIQEIDFQDKQMLRLKEMLSDFAADLQAFASFKNSEIYETLESSFTGYSETHKTVLSCTVIIAEIKQTYYKMKDRLVDLQQAINKFVGNFQENNLFKFKVKLSERAEYFEFAEMLKEFIDENKLNVYKTRVEERFANIIRRIGVETGELISKEGEISQVVRDINNDFIARNFVGAIKKMELRTVPSTNRIFRLLVDIKNYNDENAISLGVQNLFSSDNQANKNEKAISLLKQLIKEMANYKEREITLSDSFELQFRIVENDNDTDWVEKLTNVGSEGTDILVKAMINILLLNVFKERAAKKYKDDFRLHCMMDEIGKLHPNNVKGILKFANDRNILLINSSPTSYNATDYRYTYLLSKDSKNITSVKRLIAKK